MKFSYNWLKELSDFKESPEKLAEILTLRSFEVESVEKSGRDFVLDIKIPANRISDAANHWGMAREIAVITNSRFAPPHVNLISSKFKNSKIDIKIAKQDICSRYSAQILEIAASAKSPKWIEERLIACGLRPINIIVDMTNYIMLETGQPLHAFDLDKIRGKKMIIRESKQGEELTTLDGAKHKLPRGAIVIEDGEGLIDLAGIMGGANSAIDAKTKKVLIQAAVFDQRRIYQTSRALNFSTDAAKIYAGGVDSNQSLVSISRAVNLLEKIAKAKKIDSLIDIYPKKVEPAKILFRTEYANSLIGQRLPSLYYKTVFEKFGFLIEKNGADFLIDIPTARRDLKIEEDLVEEVSRIFGYEKIIPEMPALSLLSPRQNEEIFWENFIKDRISLKGFSETFLHEFSGDDELDKFFIAKDRVIELENPLNPETKYLCPRILVKYVFSASQNIKSFDDVKIFGIAKSFRQDKKNKSRILEGIDEHKDLILILSRKGARGEDEFYELKGIIDALLGSLGISDFWYDDMVDKRQTTNDKRLFHPYRFAEIKIGDTKIGNIGEIHPIVLGNIKSKARISAVEIDFDKLWRMATTEAEYKPIGKFPAIIRDIAVVVSAETKTEAVTNIIETQGGKLLVDSDLFDYFQDEEMRESGEKSLAFHLIFQSPERTLKDEEVDKLMDKIVKDLGNKGWGVRQ